MTIIRALFPATLVLALATVTLPAKAEQFLTPSQAVEKLMDGRPWAVLTGKGRRARMVFNKDGTGLFEGPMTMSTTWEIRGQEICLKMMAGVRCLRFRTVGDSVEGYAGQRRDLKLSRGHHR